MVEEYRKAVSGMAWLGGESSKSPPLLVAAAEMSRAAMSVRINALLKEGIAIDGLLIGRPKPKQVGPNGESINTSEAFQFVYSICTMNYFHNNFQEIRKSPTTACGRLPPLGLQFIYLFFCRLNFF